MNASKSTQPVGTYSGSSFYWALKMLPRHKRDAMFRVYGFCREVDDVADGTQPLATKRARLSDYRTAVEALFDSRPAIIKSVQNLAPVVADFHIAKADLLAVIDGMEADAFAAVRIADEAAFDRYLDQVACAVGRLSDKVFGLEGVEAEKLAYHLGRALQITNILRDLSEDAERDRLYLPADLLARHGITSSTPGEVLRHPSLEAALDELAERAEGCFRRADEALAHLDRSRTRPARMMKAVYREILRRLRARGLARIDQSVRLSKPLKLWFALRGILA
ncbi:MAG TPA: presqualene diphosphate synthase HpnD [Magnetovibrio sp.]